MLFMNLFKKFMNLIMYIQEQRTSVRRGFMAMRKKIKHYKEMWDNSIHGYSIKPIA